MCIRIKDNKLIFLGNRGTKSNQYDGSGVQIYKEKAHRYFIYNSNYSNLRLINSHLKKEILRSNMFYKLNKNGTQASIRFFNVDDRYGNVWFCYRNDHQVYIYSFIKRKLITKVQMFPETLLTSGKSTT
jgi:hypothetical protein